MNVHVAKLSADEEARLLQLFDVQEKNIKRSFLEFVRDAKSDAPMKEILTLLDQNRVDDAINYINRFVDRLGNTVVEAFRQSVSTNVAGMAGRIAELNPRIIVSFDSTSPRVVQIMQQNKFEFIQEFTEEQRQATRYALTEALSQGYGSRQAAIRFRQSIGLTTTQLRAVDNYRALLEGNSAEALSRNLRDRRSDNATRNAINSGRALNKDQIDRMVARYEQRYLIYRSENIARTEMHAAVSQGNDEAVRQVTEQSGIDPSQIKRTWHTNLDGRERDWHETMNGQTVGLDEPFIDGLGNRLMYAGDKKAPAKTIISCRCWVTHQIGQVN